MAGNQITEGKLKDKRFRTTEEAIMLAFFSIRISLSVEHLVRTAGISRSTLYRHHKTFYDIIPDYEAYILRKYKSTVAPLIKKKNFKLRSLYQRVLIFMVVNKKILELISRHGSQKTVESIVAFLEPKVKSSNKITNHTIFMIYVKEVSGLIEEWQRSGFSKDEIPDVLDKIMYLTDTAHSRLSPIAVRHKPGTK